MTIKHVRKGGKVVDSVSGVVVSAKEFPTIYKSISKIEERMGKLQEARKGKSNGNVQRY